MKRVFKLSEVKATGNYLTPLVRSFEPVYLPGDRVEFGGRVWTVLTSNAERDVIVLED